MRNVKRVHSIVRRSVPIVPPALERHELHRAIDGDWSPADPSRVELRESLVIGLAAVAMLPLVDLLLEAWPGASREARAAIASLPLVALILVAITWRSGGGRS